MTVLEQCTKNGVSTDSQNAVKLGREKQFFLGAVAQQFFAGNEGDHERRLADFDAVVRPESRVKSSLVPAGVEWSVFVIAAIQAGRQECLSSAYNGPSAATNK
jgi:hypothetical protein